MAKYLARACPRCGDYLGIVISEPQRSATELPIRGACMSCGYRLPLLKIIVGKRVAGVALLVALLSFIAVPSPTAHAWNNGQTGNTTTDQASECDSPPYATHDWIPDHALNLGVSNMTDVLHTFFLDVVRGQ